MKIYTLIYQKPLRIKTYSSLVALFEDNTQEQLGVSKSKLDRFDFDSTYFVSTKVIINRSVPLSSGDVRRKKMEDRDSL